MQPDVFADAVVVMVKNALAPVLADVKALQSQVSVWEARWNDVGALRERMAVVEIKAAQPAIVPAVESEAVDLSPVLERLAASEARLSVLGDLRDRMVVVETKAAQVVVPPTPEPTPQVDLSPLFERMSASEARLAVLGDLRDRVVVVETKAAQPVVPPTPEPLQIVDLSPVLERLAATEARLDTLGDLRDRVVTIETKAAMPLPPMDASRSVTLVELGDVRDRVGAIESELRLVIKAGALEPVIEKYEALGVEVNGLRERLAVAEMRQLVPGPAGRDGNPGRDGKDGLDGLGYDELGVEQLDERSFAVKAMRGLQVRELGKLTFAVQIYRGVYQDGKTYDRGDEVTWAGSSWHCNETTNTKPGDGSKAWTLKVKRGRDGKDFTPPSSSTPLAVVSVGKR